MLAVVVSIPVSPLFARLFDSDDVCFVIHGEGSKMQNKEICKQYDKVCIEVDCA